MASNVSLSVTGTIPSIALAFRHHHAVCSDARCNKCTPGIARGHTSATIVCDLGTGHVIDIAPDRGTESVYGFIGRFSLDELAGIKAVAIDMWQQPSTRAMTTLLPDANGQLSKSSAVDLLADPIALLGSLVDEDRAGLVKDAQGLALGMDELPERPVEAAFAQGPGMTGLLLVQVEHAALVLP